MSTLFSRRVLRLLAAAGLLAGLVLLAPSSLGGTATWVSTMGASMQPDIETGDLVIARPQPSYHVGDVVAFRSDGLEGTIVLHRIVAEKPESVVTRGDNNDWLDPDQPQRTEILGRMWLHVPGGGRVLSLFADPWFMAALIAATLAMGGLFAARRRGRGVRRGRTAAGRKAQALAVGFPAREGAAIAAVAAGALAVFAFGRPVLSPASDEIDVQHTARLSYSAEVTTAGVYSRDRLRTGDPVLLAVAPTVDTQLDYRLGFDPGPISGTIRSTIKLSASNGWQRQVRAGATGTVAGTRIERSLPLDFAALLEIVRTAEQRAETTFGGYTVELVHHIDATGRVGDEQATTRSAPSLTFTVNDQQAVLQGDGSSPRIAGQALTTTDVSSIAVSRSTPSTVTLLRWEIPVSLLRMLALGLGVTALALAGLALAGRPRPRVAFGRRQVQVSNMDFGDRSVVDVDDPAALGTLATMYDTVVLDLTRAQDRLFVVVAEQTVYRYAEPLIDPRRARNPHTKSALSRT